MSKLIVVDPGIAKVALRDVGDCSAHHIGDFLAAMVAVVIGHVHGHVLRARVLALSRVGKVRLDTVPERLAEVVSEGGLVPRSIPATHGLHDLAEQVGIRHLLGVVAAACGKGSDRGVSLAMNRDWKLSKPKVRSLAWKTSTDYVAWLGVGARGGEAVPEYRLRTTPCPILSRSHQTDMCK